MDYVGLDLFENDKDSIQNKEITYSIALGVQVGNKYPCI